MSDNYIQAKQAIELRQFMMRKSKYDVAGGTKRDLFLAGCSDEAIENTAPVLDRIGMSVSQLDAIRGRLL